MFKITIEKTVEVTKIGGKVWDIISKDENGKEERGYTPEIERRTTETVDIYQQVVDELDIYAVIQAVNGKVNDDTESS